MKRFFLALLCVMPLLVVAVSPMLAQPFQVQAESNGFILKKLTSASSIATGQSFEYTLRYSLVAGATNVVISDDVPDPLEVISVSASPIPYGAPTVSTQPVAGGTRVTVSWATTITGNGEGSISIWVRFPNGITCNGTTVRNRAHMTAQLGPLKIDFFTPHISTSAIATNPWQITKAIVNPALVPGTCPYGTDADEVEYKITVKKVYGTTGQLNLVDGVVTDILPNGATLVAGSSTCMTVNGSTLEWHLPLMSALPGYNQVTCSFKVRYPSGQFPPPNTVTNQATLTGTLGGSGSASCGPVSITSNETCIQLLPIVPPNGYIQKWQWTNRQPGCKVKYRIYIRNDGNAPMASFTATDDIPAILESSAVVIFHSPSTTATINGGVLTITGATPALGVGQSVYVDYECTIPSTTAPGTSIENCVTLDVPGSPPKSSCVNFTVLADAPVPHLSKDVCNLQTSYAPGQSFRYRLRMVNTGGQAIAAGTVVTDVLNPNLEYIGPPLYYSSANWNIPCQSASNWTGVSFAQPVQNTLEFTLPAMPADCGNTMYYFIEFEVRIRPESDLGHIPNRYTMHGGNVLTVPEPSSNTCYVLVSAHATYSLEKLVSGDGVTWASTVSVPPNATVHARLRMNVGAGSPAFRHVTFADLLPIDNIPGGSADELMLACPMPRGSAFSLGYVSTSSMVPTGTTYHNNAAATSYAQLDTYGPAGAPSPMFVPGVGCGSAGSWVSPSVSGSKNPGYYFGTNAVTAGNSATAQFLVQVPASVLPSQTAVNTFVGNAATRHICLGTNSTTIPYDAVLAEAESPKAFIKIDTLPSVCDTVIFTARDSCAFDASFINTNPHNVAITDFHIRVVSPASGVSLTLLSLPASPVAWSQSNNIPGQIDLQTAPGSGGLPVGALFSGLRFQVSPRCTPVVIHWFTTGRRPDLRDTVICEGYDSLYCEGCVEPPTGMVGWWTGDGNTNDISGFGNHGSLVGGAGYTTGEVLQGFSLNATTQYVRVPDNTSLNFGTGDLSIDAWVRMEPTAVTRTIVDKRTGDLTNTTGYHFFIHNGRLGFQLGDGGATYNAIAPNANGFSGTIPRHVAVTVDRDMTDGGKLYVDGQLVHTFDPVPRSGSITNSADLWIGQRMIYDVEPFNGMIDEVEIFNRVISQQEILSIVQAGNCGKCKSNTPITGSLCGVKYNDLDGDGVRDPGEVGMPGWTITVMDQDTGVWHVTTGANGLFCIDSLQAGTYFISETQQSGWTQTDPQGNGTYTVTLQPGQTIDTLLFGNHKGNDCDDVIQGSSAPDPFTCTYNFQVNNVLGTQITSIDMLVRDGTFNTLSFTLPGSTTFSTLPASLPGNVYGEITFTPPVSGNLSGSISIVPQQPDGWVTVVFVIHHGQILCRDSITWRCCVEEPCDSVWAVPFLFGQLDQDWKTFHVQSMMSSPIRWVEITLDPALSSAPPCPGNHTGGGLTTNAEGYLPLEFYHPYVRVPSGASDQLTVGASHVSFNLGINYFCNWNGAVVLAIHHENGRVCMFRYEGWHVQHPGTGRFVTASQSGRRLFAQRITVKNSGARGSWKWIGISVDDPADEIWSALAASVPGTETAPNTAVLDRAVQSARSATFELRIPVSPGASSDPLNIVIARDSIRPGAPRIRVTTYDENGNAVYTDTVSILTSTISLQQNSLPEDFQILHTFPNPATGQASVNILLGHSMDVQLDVLDERGRRCLNLVNERKEAGVHTVTCDTRGLAAGLYHVRLSSNGKVAVQPMLVVK